MATTPTVRRPAEFEAHERTWMVWPHRRDLYGDRLEAVQLAYAEVARTIAQFEPVAMVAHPDYADEARRQLGGAAIVVEIPIDDCWMRDIGPTFVISPNGRLKGVSWRFNAWGQKHSPWDEDDALAGRLLEREGIDTCPSWLRTEGGALACDGEGTLIVTETSILNHNRNPGVPKSMAQRELKAMLGVQKVIWLPGDPLDAETDGHIDGFCCFVRPGVVLFVASPDPAGMDGRIFEANLDSLRAQTDARGREFEIIPLREAEMTSDGVYRSYINLYIANGGIVMPGYGIPADAQAKETVARAFPDRRVVQVDANAIAPGGGAIHCITQEQPRRRAG